MKHRLSKVIFICATIACVGLRVYLKLASVDPATGFYEGNPFPVAVFNLLLAAAVIALLFLGYTKKPAGKLSVGRPVRVLAALAGAAALLVSGLEILAITDAIKIMVVADTTVGFNAAVVALLFRLCGVVSGFVFLAIALRLREDGTCGISPFLLLFPLVWQICCLLTTFMAYTAIRSVSDQLLATLTMVLLAPFLLAHGRVLGNVNMGKGLRQLAAFGLPFSLLALTSSVGVIVSFFAGRTVPFATSLPEAVFYLVMGLYVAALTLSAGEAPVAPEIADGTPAPAEGAGDPMPPDTAENA